MSNAPRQKAKAKGGPVSVSIVKVIPVRSLPIPRSSKAERFAATVLVALAMAACGGGTAGGPAIAPVGPRAPTDAANAIRTASPSGGDLSVWAVPDGPREDAPISEPTDVRLDAWRSAITKAKLPSAPAACAEFVRRAPSRPPPPDVAHALAERDMGKRDAMLVALGTLDPLAASATLALRADLALVECGDAMVDPELAKAAAATGRAPSLLVGLSLAAKLSRTAASPPVIANTNDKAKVKQFINGPLKTWMREQALAIDLLAAGAAGLTGYGRGIAAIEAGLADLRLVDTMRSAPVPASWDVELRRVYEQILDEALEPRKRRGRDAALVGMGDFAREGVIKDPRIDRARVMLSKLYGGRRIDALDALLLPQPVSSPTSTSASAFWMNQSTDVPLDLARGYPQRVRALARVGNAEPDARARFDMGRLYWRKVDFVEAAHATKKSAKPEDRLILALSLALARGAVHNAADMMAASSPSQLDLVHTEALDALVADSGPMAGMAAFDAAHLRSLSPPESGAADHLRDVAARFKKAASLFSDPTEKAKAEARAADAEAAARAATR